MNKDTEPTTLKEKYYACPACKKGKMIQRGEWWVCSLHPQDMQLKEDELK